MNTPTFRVHFQLVNCTNSVDDHRVQIRCQSPAGSSSRRSVTLGVEPYNSAVLDEFVRRARALRTIRPLTVRETAALLSEILIAVRQSIQD